MSKRVKVELLIVQITGDAAVATGEDINASEETIRGTKTRLRLKLERTPKQQDLRAERGTDRGALRAARHDRVVSQPRSLRRCNSVNSSRHFQNRGGGSVMPLDLTDPASIIAEARRRQQLRDAGATTFEPTAIVAGDRVIDDAELGRLEKEIELECDRVVLSIGGKVVKFSHPGKTKQTPGIADRLYGFPWLKLAVWWECKTPEGKQRPDQKLFQEDVVACGQLYALGGLGDLKSWLVAHGVVAGFNTDGTPIPLLRGNAL